MELFQEEVDIVLVGRGLLPIPEGQQLVCEEHDMASGATS